MHSILSTALTAFFFALGLAFAFGVFLAMVYGLMWLLHSLLEQPYAAASSTTFVLLSLTILWNSTKSWFASKNKLTASLLTLYAIVSGPLILAVAFNLHSAWTNAEITGGRYLPGEYWSLVSGNVAWAAGQVMAVAPVVGDVYETVSSNNLLSNVVAMAFGALVLTPLQRRLFPVRAVAHA